MSHIAENGYWRKWVNALIRSFERGPFKLKKLKDGSCSPVEEELFQIGRSFLVASLPLYAWEPGTKRCGSFAKLGYRNITVSQFSNASISRAASNLLLNASWSSLGNFAICLEFHWAASNADLELSTRGTLDNSDL